MKKNPNIVLITTDQMRADAIGYINSKVITPNLDMMAKEGAVFTNSFCSSPVCTPSRAGIFTGRYPMNTGAWNIGTCLDENEITLADWLKGEGYYNIGVGKMHFRPQLKDFDNNYEDVEVRDRVRERDKTYYGFDETYITEDDKQGKYLDFLAENGYHLEVGKGDDGINPLPEEFNQTYWIGMKSCEAIRKHDFNKPLFMMTNFVDPHHPFDPAEKFARMYDGVEIDSPISKDKFCNERPEYLKRQGERGYWPGGGEQHKLSDEKVEEYTRYYYAMITFIDQEIGKIRKELEKKGELDNTIIIFTSDHGEYMGDYGLLQKGPFMYDNLIKVPLLFWGKGVEKSVTSDEIVENIDIVPTILELIGKEVPYGIQGESLKNILQKIDKERVKKSAIVTYDARDRGIMVKSYRDKRYKLNLFMNEEYGEMYDLEVDPQETTNLFFKEEYLQLKNELLLKACYRMMECSDPLSKRTANW